MYKVEFTLQAEEDLSHIDKAVAKRIADKIEWFCQNTEHVIKEPLTGKFKGKYKLRVGDWRIIYSIEHFSQIITVYAIEHRNKIYKT
jgi:mRNA interferase RelE/StbE